MSWFEPEKGFLPVHRYTTPNPLKTESYKTSKELINTFGKEYAICGIISTTVFESGWALYKKLPLLYNELYITQHSCSSITYVLDELIGLGLNAIEPVQVRAYDMDFESLVKRYAYKVVLQGSIDTQKTLPIGTIEDVRNEVLSRIRLFKDRGGSVLGPSQHLLQEIPIENILEMYKTANEYTK